MEIKLSKYAGFCSGVKRAIDTVMNLPTKNTYIYGNIIHNESVLLDIKNKGIITIEDLSLLKKEDTIVIRSHGVGEEVFNYLNSKSITIEKFDNAGHDIQIDDLKKLSEIVEKFLNSLD